MDINATGENLSVVIAARTREDWQAYTTWFSINSFLPESNIVLACFRDGDVEFQYFQWAKRIKLPQYYMYFRNETFLDYMQCILLGMQRRLLTNNVLLLQAGLIACDALQDSFLEILNTADFVRNEFAVFVRNRTEAEIAELIDDYMLLGEHTELSETPLYSEARESSEEHSIISFIKGCGRWIDRMKGCPLASAGALATTEMTANEARVIELWKKAASFYSAVH